MTRRQRALWLALAALVLISLDQTTKRWAEETLAHRPTASYLGDTIRIGLTINHGVFLGMGDRLAEPLRFALFVILVGLGLIVATVYALGAPRLRPPVFLALALIVPGGLGNLIDRVTNQGGVVDFMNVGLGPVRTGIFNVADMAVTAGVLVLFFSSLRGGKESSGDVPSDSDGRTAG